MVTEDDVIFWADQLTTTERDNAQQQFTQEYGEELLQNCVYLSKVLSSRFLSVQNGNAPKIFGAYDSDELIRLLTANMALVYLMYNPLLDVDYSAYKNPKDAMTSGLIDTISNEGEIRNDFIKAYSNFLYTCASLAKSIGAATSMRMFLKAWQILQDARSNPECDNRLDLEDAQRLLNLDKIATQRLTIDLLAADLPEFKSVKSSRSSKKGDAK